MAKNFYISDLHLFHESVLKNGRLHERPFETLEEMHDTILNNWNSVVANGDTVYLLGDVAYSSKISETAAFLGKLKGNIVLIKGNHDRIKDQRIKRRFAEICDYKEISDNYDGRAHSVVLSHYPIFSWKEQFKGAIHLYGHVHDNDDDQLYQGAITKSDMHFWEKDGDRHHTFTTINVGCMKNYMNYTPKTLKELLEIEGSMCFGWDGNGFFKRWEAPDEQ